MMKIKDHSKNTLLYCQNTLEYLSYRRGKGSGVTQDSGVPDLLTKKKLRMLGTKDHVRIGVYDFANTLTLDYVLTDFSRSYSIFPMTFANIDEFDVNFFNAHLLYNENDMHQMYWRTLNKNQINVAWLVDHHHAFSKMVEIVSRVDAFAYAHPTRVDYLNTAFINNFGLFPCAPFQWSQELLLEQLGNALKTTRSNALYGKFNGYSNFERDSFLQLCHEQIADSEIRVVPYGTPLEQTFFAMTPVERLLDWAKFKCSISVSVNQDCPIRIVDALLTGQIPLVADDVFGFEQVIPAEDQIALPIVRYNPYDVDSVKMAHALAIRLFDRDGMQGVERRSKYVLDHLTLKQYIVRKLIPTLELKIQAAETIVE